MGRQPEHDRVRLTLDEARVILGMEVRELRDIIVATFAPVVDGLVRALATFTSAVLPLVVSRYAVEVLGVPESDIRRATPAAVQLWNWRRIPINPDDLFAWISDREGRP